MHETGSKNAIHEFEPAAENPLKAQIKETDILRFRGEVLNAFSVLESRWAQLAKKYDVEQKLSIPFGSRVEYACNNISAHKDAKKITGIIEKLQPLIQRRAHIVHSQSSVARCENGTKLFIFKHVPIDNGVATIMHEEELTLFLRKIKEISNQVNQLL